MAYTLQQLQSMGAVPVESQTANVYQGKGKKYSIEELQSLGATPVEEPQAKKEGGLLKIAANVADTIFGGGKVGEALATSKIRSDIRNGEGAIEADYSKLSPQALERLKAKGIPTSAYSQREETANQVEGPSKGQIAGSALQSASLFLPTTKAAGIAAKAVGGGKIANALVKTGINAAEGYVGDVAANLAEGKENTFTPGGQTLLAGGLPAIGGLARGGKKVVGKVAENAAPAVTGLARGVKNVISAPLEYGAEKLAQEKATRLLPKAEQALVRSGFDDKSVQFIKTMTPKTKAGAKEMIQIAEKASKDARYRVQPQQVVGKSFLRRVDTLQKDSVKAAGEIKKIASSLPKEPVDFTPAFDDFKNALKERGISTDKAGNLISKGNVPSSELKYYDSILKEIKMATGGQTYFNRQKAHQLRQRLFATLESEARKGTKPGERPFSDIVDRDINRLRGNLAEIIGGDYKKAAQRYAENEVGLRETAKILGTPNDWDKLSSKDLKASEVLMRVLGNASDRPQTLLNTIDALAKKRGGKYGDNINDLIDFADAMEEIYGISKTRGFAGGVQRGTNQSGIALPTTMGEFALKALQASTKTRNEDKQKALKGIFGV